MTEQRTSDIDRREFLSIVAMVATAVLTTTLLPESVPVEDGEVADDDEPLWIGGY